MGHTNSGVCGVDALTAVTRCTEYIHADIVHVDMHVHFFRFGQYRYRNRRGMDSTTAFCGRDTLYTVYAAFVFQTGICPLSCDHKGNFLITAQIAFAGVHDFDFPFPPFCVTGIHAEQVCRKECRFVTACTAADFHNNVFLVIRVFGDQQNGDFFLQFFQTFFVFRQFFLHQFPEIVVQFIFQKLQLLRNGCFHFFVFPICLHDGCHIAVFLHQFPPLALIGNDIRVVDLICQIHIFLFNFRQSVKHEAPPSSVQRPRDPALPSPDDMPQKRIPLLSSGQTALPAGHIQFQKTASPHP